MKSGINTGSKDSKSDLCQDDYKTATVLKERVKKTTDRDKNRDSGSHHRNMGTLQSQRHQSVNTLVQTHVNPMKDFATLEEKNILYSR